MLVPLKWLREFVDFDLSALELADLLTDGGLEVEAVENRLTGLTKVVTAKVLSVEPHPDADRLRLAVVECGGQSQTVVCGAPNLEAGMISPLAQVGAVLGDGEFEIKAAKIRGVESLGMLCSERDLGLSDDHGGIMALASDLAPGLALAEALNLETEVLEIGVTPNRGDALSILGVARDVAALLDLPLSMPSHEPHEAGDPIEGQATVELIDTKGCPRYAARLLKGIAIAPSPLWMRDRLMACGVRPINNVVDVTNYVLMEMGQPLHAFDFKRLAGGKIVVRLAQPGEKFHTLDGQERPLSEDTLMICDGQGSVAVAGVMGGLNSEVEDNTTEVLIESAFFDPISVRRTSKRLGLSTEASYRFERGMDLEGCARACGRAALLMAQLTGAAVAPGIIDAYPVPYQAPRLELSIKRTAAYLGIPLTRDEVVAPLKRLGIEVEAGQDDDHIVARPPAARTDLERPVDLTEEVARMKGYNNIPAAMPKASLSAKPRAWQQRLRARARDAMAAQGLDEAITYSFAHPDAVEHLGLQPDDPRRRVVKLMNPLSEDLSQLRTSLLPGLLQAAQHNLAHRVADVALFEVGKAFIKRDDEPLPWEPTRLAAVIANLAQPTSWWDGEVPVSLSHIKGVVEYLAESLDLDELSFELPAEAPPYLDPAQWCQVTLGGQLLGELGRLSSAAAKAFDIERPTYLMDLDFDLLTAQAPRSKSFTRLPRYPEVVRDVALILDEAVPAGQILALARSADDPWLVAVEVFDLYRGKPLAKGEKSLGLRFTYRSEERTLTEEEVTPGYDALLKNLMTSFSATLRA